MRWRVVTEDDFQKKLDEHPDDWQTRLVFADWLDERSDPRAEGFRALAACRYVLCDRYAGVPLRYIPRRPSRIFCAAGNNVSGRDYTLPPDWYEKIGEKKRGHKPSDACITFKTRRAAEDAAALAFAALPAKRRAELLRGGERGGATCEATGARPGRGGSTRRPRRRAGKSS